MSEAGTKRDSSVKHSKAWVESSFTTESPSAPKRRRVDTLAQEKTGTRIKPKPPAWIASEFRSEASPSKPTTRPAPPRPQDPGIIRAPTRPTSEFTDPNATLDPKPKQQFPLKQLAVQPVPGFLPKTCKDESVHRARETLFRIQAPTFQTGNSSSAAPEGATILRDVRPMPPAPRIEVKGIPAAAHVPIHNDKDFVQLTDLIMPRVLEISSATIGKGNTRVVTRDEIPPISDNQSVEEATRAVEDVQNNIDAFGMSDLSLELDPDTTLVGHSEDVGRKEANKFIKGGLAARALMVITRREKDDALWHHYQTAKLGKNSNNREDLRARVVQVLQPIGESVLVRCSLLSALPTSAADIPTTSGGSSNTLNDLDLVNVLLSQPGAKAPPAVGPSSVIRLWRPWIEVDLDAGSRPLPASLEGERDDKHPRANGAADKRIGYTKERLAGLPPHEQHSRSDSEKSALDPHPRRALLCSRFVVG